MPRARSQGTVWPAAAAAGVAPDGSAAIDHLSLACSGYAVYRARFIRHDLDWREFLVPGTSLWQLFVYDPSGVQLELTFEGKAESGPRPDMDGRRYIAGPHITVRGLVKRFGANTLYDGFDLDIPNGRIISIFGPNGCGKSTLINMMAGILPFDGGQILFDGKDVRETRIGYVFQNYREAVFPWLRAIDNIRYPLKFLNLSKAEKDARIERLIASFDVKIDLNRYPYEMSGGQQQMVSIMRALVVDPEVLFLDEPFSALDYEMTHFLREKLQKVFAERAITTLLVSHDLDEAVYLADHVLLLTRNQTSIADFVAFNAPHPRTADATLTPEFLRVKAHTLEVFQREVRK